MKTNRIAVFFGGEINEHLAAIRSAAEKLKVDLELISFSRVLFDTADGEVLIQGESSDDAPARKADEFDVVFFRMVGKYWEEIALLTDSLRRSGVRVVDPVVRAGNPFANRKAHQMLALSSAGLPVPRSIYGSLPWLCEEAKHGLFPFPLILKGSAGHGGANVYKMDRLEDLNTLAKRLWPGEAKEGRKYMLQEFIENDGDYRLLVLGDKVLGTAKLRRAPHGDFPNSYAVDGSMEAALLPEAAHGLAVQAARVCGLAFAAVDVVFREDDMNKPSILEVSGSPSFEGFAQVLGIDVPAELVKFLSTLGTED